MGLRIMVEGFKDEEHRGRSTWSRSSVGKSSNFHALMVRVLEFKLVHISLHSASRVWYDTRMMLQGATCVSRWGFVSEFRKAYGRCGTGWFVWRGAFLLKTFIEPWQPSLPMNNQRGGFLPIMINDSANYIDFFSRI